MADFFFCWADFRVCAARADVFLVARNQRQTSEMTEFGIKKYKKQLYRRKRLPKKKVQIEKVALEKKRTREKEKNSGGLPFFLDQKKSVRESNMPICAHVYFLLA